ncbi:hypothetical protein B0H17DRAFT_1195463 [Mycena rosella]|uniref:Uncharacterized protein n=1 Tax=Mycena rosella TaxID=1033263 RepID=A0AAD7GPH4_MYCRO|nr:hypothetical protein B0H17DRAFT_1195463 [Mycena rosella]
MHADFMRPGDAVAWGQATLELSVACALVLFTFFQLAGVLGGRDCGYAGSGRRAAVEDEVGRIRSAGASNFPSVRHPNSLSYSLADISTAYDANTEKGDCILPIPSAVPRR